MRPPLTHCNFSSLLAAPTSACRRVGGRLAAADGFALGAALIVLLIVSVLAAASVTVAVNSSSSTTTDASRKAAMAAAEAGLKIATYRLTMLNPAASDCVAGSSVAAPVGGYCGSGAPQQLGNGGTFTYTTTAALDETSQCVGLTIVGQTSLEQRCVTATGTVNGVTQRVEARVATFTAQPLFPFPEVGMIGLDGVEDGGAGAAIESGLGSNGKIKLEGAGGKQTGKCLLGPSGAYEANPPSNKLCSEEVMKRTPAEGELVLSPVKPGNAEVDGNCPQVAEPDPSGNCDQRIIEGMRKADNQSYAPPYDQISGKTGSLETAQTMLEKEHVLELAGAGVTLTLGGGVYFFCRVSVKGSHSTIAIAQGARTAIFVGSPKCGAKSGEFLLEGAGTSIENSGAVTNLQIYVYGAGPVRIAGAGNTTTGVVLYAPEAEVTINGAGGTLEGGIAGKHIGSGGAGFKFKWNEQIKDIEPGAAGAVNAYYRTAWGQCTPEGSPGEGC